MNEYVGTVGERVRLTLTCLSSHFIDTDYDDATLVVYEDADGNVVKWFKSGIDDTIPVGTTAEYEATIKEHREFEGKPETHVKRVSVYVEPERKKDLAKLRKVAKGEYDRLRRECDAAWDSLASGQTIEGVLMYRELRDAAVAAYYAWKAI